MSFSGKEFCVVGSADGLSGNPVKIDRLGRALSESGARTQPAWRLLPAAWQWARPARHCFPPHEPL